MQTRVMKVTLLTTSFPLTPQSTSGIFVARLADKLAEIVDISVITPADGVITHRLRRGRLVVVPCRYAPKNWQRLAHEPGGMPVATRNNPRLWLLLPGLLLSLGWQCLREARTSDVIHANWALCGLIAGIVGKLLGKPVVTTLRGDDVTRAEKNSVDMLMLKMCFLTSGKIICVSSDMLDWLEGNFPRYRQKTILIENGVDDAFIRVGESRQNEKPGDEIRLITIGSLIPRKGIDLVLQACAKIPSTTGFRLIIAGSGPEEEKLKQLTETLNLSNHVEFTGMLAPDDIPAKLRQSDIFLLASHSEGRPNVLLEAMASGLPVIASDIRGIRELIEDGETGLLFKDGSVDMLAVQVLKLMSDPMLRNKLGQGGRSMILKRNLFWHETAARYMKIYENISRR